MRADKLLCACAFGLLSVLALACGDDDEAEPSTPAIDSGAMNEPLPENPLHLANDTAGVPCTKDADCEGGRCELETAASGGFCTRTCDHRQECGSGAVCEKYDNGEGLCLQACTKPTDCREGFVCTGAVAAGLISYIGSCEPLARIETLADGVAGRACTQASDCEGGECASTNLLGGSYPGNYCTNDCYEDQQCGAGGVCLWPHGRVEPGSCLLQCSTDADCTRDGYRCWELGDGMRTFHACYPAAEPLADHEAGKPCEQDGDCAAPASCAHELPYGSLANEDMTDAPDGYCTQDCARDIDCGAGAQCINRGRLGGMCLAVCTDSEPCRDGYVCGAHLRDADPNAKVCLPPDPNLAVDTDAGI